MVKQVRDLEKKGYRISKSHAKNTLYLAWNDIISSPKRFLNIIISFGICSLFLLVLANTTATMDSNAFIDTFGTRSDLYVREIKENVIDYSSFTDKKKLISALSCIGKMEKNSMASFKIN